ncbi:MAG: putative Fe-S cluster assembly protein SufT [Nevskiaceae bacterium]|nr:MAG: putative Fe-S cluster assembly protein SufT [Nevskiaceae bacterium]TBR72504.1 MAG: putative Fe-S cluster assembly protein SufT [Nevskiaceae bacterium]
MSQSDERVTLTRDVVGVLIPAGTHVELPEGVEAVITQALGGSYTVLVEGHLFRIPAEDADALGKQAAAKVKLPEHATDEDVEKAVYAQLMTCYDPEIPINIVDLGLVYESSIELQPDGTRHVKIVMTLTAPGCGMGDILVNDVKEKVGHLPGISQIDVEMTFDPPWRMDMMSEEARLQSGLM